MYSKLSDKQESESVRRYKEGESTPKIAEDFDVCPKTIQNVLDRNGVSRRKDGVDRKFNLNEEVFEKLNSETEYWIGFLMGDGSVEWLGENSARIRLSLNKRDIDHIKKFRNFLGSDHKVRERSSRGTVKFTIHSTKLVNHLEEWGVVQEKTYSTKAVPPLDESKHFWRGCIDADGSIGKYGDDYVPQMYLCGSEELIEQFNNFITDRFPNRVSVSEHKSIYRVCFKGYYVEDVLEFLYEDEKPFLVRKQKTAIGILKQA